MTTLTIDGDALPAVIDQLEKQVGKTTIDNNGDERPVLYNFEGADVTFTKGKITSVTGMELDDQIFRIDDTVRMMVECVVTQVNHAADERSGLIARVHTLKAVDGQVLPWNVTAEHIRAAIADAAGL